MGDDGTRETVLPLALGVGAVLAGLVGPSVLGVVGTFVGAGMAGWFVPANPIRAGALTFVPTGLLAMAAYLFRDVATSAIIFALIGGFMWSLVASHFGAGLALRRGRPEAPDRG